MSERNAPTIDRTIYPMPMFATFRVTDLAAAEAFYQSVGFVSLATIRAADGFLVEDGSGENDGGGAVAETEVAR
jgi:hypothetical protein